VQLLARLSDWMSGESFLLAGDFNSCRLADKRWPEWHHLELFERIEADFGILNCYWHLHQEILPSAPEARGRARL